MRVDLFFIGLLPKSTQSYERIGLRAISGCGFSAKESIECLAVDIVCIYYVDR